MPKLHSGGVDLHYEVAGGGDLIVLTHGSWSDSRSWSAVVPYLAEEYRVVTWDRRGHGRSSDGPGGMRQDAVDLSRLLGSLGASAHLVGVSFGAIVAMKALETDPELVRSVVVHEPPLLGMLNSDEFAEDVADERRKNEIVVEVVRQGRLDDAAEYFVDHMAVGPGAWARLPQPARDSFSSNAPTFVEDNMDTFDPHPIDLESVNSADAHLLVTAGTQSPPLLEGAVRLLQARLDSARFETLEGAGHMPHRTHPEMLSESVLGFLGSQSAAQPST